MGHEGPAPRKTRKIEQPIESLSDTLTRQEKAQFQQEALEHIYEVFSRLPIEEHAKDYGYPYRGLFTDRLISSRIRAHEYASVIGDDKGSRMHACTVGLAINRIYQFQGQERIPVLFIDPNTATFHRDAADPGQPRHVPLTPEERARHAELYEEVAEKAADLIRQRAGTSGSILLLTDFVSSGASIRFFKDVAERVGVPIDVVSHLPKDSDGLLVTDAPDNPRLGHRTDGTGIHSVPRWKGHEDRLLMESELAFDGDITSDEVWEDALRRSGVPEEELADVIRDSHLNNQSDFPNFVLDLSKHLSDVELNRLVAERVIPHKTKEAKRVIRDSLTSANIVARRFIADTLLPRLYQTPTPTEKKRIADWYVRRLEQKGTRWRPQKRNG